MQGGWAVGEGWRGKEWGTEERSKEDGVVLLDKTQILNRPVTALGRKSPRHYGGQSYSFRKDDIEVGLEARVKFEGGHKQPNKYVGVRKQRGTSEGSTEVWCCLTVPCG